MKASAQAVTSTSTIVCPGFPEGNWDALGIYGEGAEDVAKREQKKAHTARCRGAFEYLKWCLRQCLDEQGEARSVYGELNHLEFMANRMIERYGEDIG